MYQQLLSREQGDVGMPPLVASLLTYHRPRTPLSNRRSDHLLINIIDVSSTSHRCRIVSKLAVNC